ncbi:MAG: hypothetical protein RL367_25 [Pseudomonadota bacterium]
MSDWNDRNDAPMLTAEIAARAELRHHGRLVRTATGTMTKPGRPPVGEEAKEQVSLRVDREVLNWFRAGGKGWQTRMYAALR